MINSSFDTTELSIHLNGAESLHILSGTILRTMSTKL